MNGLRALSVLLFAASLAGAGDASARHWHGHGNVGVRVVVDPFWYGPAYYPYPYVYSPLYYPPYYSPPAVGVVPAMPQEYIERADEAAPGASAYWYWCPGAQRYYPEVKQCPAGWVPVPPRAPAAPREGGQ